MVSVVIPIYNRQDLITTTINSIINQSYKDWELILVDDGSTDGSIKIAEEFARKDIRVKLIKRDRQPKGASVCRNIGLSQAKGDYVIFLDSDDLLATYCIERRIQYVKANPELDFWVFPMLLFKEKPDDMRILQNIPTGEDDLDRFLKRENVWLMSSPIWKRTSLEKIGGFNESYLSFQDWELNTKALIYGLRYKFFAESPPDNFYRQHSSDTISKHRFSPSHNESNVNMIINTFNLLKKNERVNELRRLALAGFLADVLMRFRYEVKPQSYIKVIKKYLNKAIHYELIKKGDSLMILVYFYLHTLKIAYLSEFYRKTIEFIHKQILLKRFYTKHQSHQMKHIYNGELS